MSDIKLLEHAKGLRKNILVEHRLLIVESGNVWFIDNVEVIP